MAPSLRLFFILALCAGSALAAKEPRPVDEGPAPLGWIPEGGPREFDYEGILAITPRYHSVRCLVDLLPRPRNAAEAAAFLDRAAATLIKATDVDTATPLHAAYFEGEGVDLVEGLIEKKGVMALFHRGYVQDGKEPFQMDALFEAAPLYYRIFLLHELVHMAHTSFWRQEEVRQSFRAGFDFEMASELVAHDVENAVASAIPLELLTAEVEALDIPALVRAELHEDAAKRGELGDRAQYLEFYIGRYLKQAEIDAQSSPLARAAASVRRQRSASEYVRLFLEEGRPTR